jgi:hypothetical protein
MPTSLSDDGVAQTIEARGLREGNPMKTANAGTSTASSPLYIDSQSKIAVGGFPFAVSFLAGVTDTSFSAQSFTGSSTGTAADAMHQTLVSGALASFTASGFVRVTVTDNAGNITNGSYYVPFGILA